MGARVLVVDDAPRDLEYYAALVRSAGFAVSTSASCAEGARRLQHEPFDLVIVSQGEAEFTGRCVLERAVEVDRSMPVVVLTRHFDLRCYAEAVQLGAVDYLEKPVKPDDLLWVLSTHLKQAAPIGSLCAHNA